MGKLRILAIILVFYSWSNTAKAQYYDTFPRYGFSSAREAADTLFARLLNKELSSIQVFTIDYKTFITETRKSDTAIPEQMIRGQYITYWSRSERSFKKVWKQLKKSKVSAKKAVFDTVLLYRNSGTDVLRAELYLKQKNYKAYVKYQLWKVNGKWYFTGKFEAVEEKYKKPKS